MYYTEMENLAVIKAYEELILIDGAMNHEEFSYLYNELGNSIENNDQTVEQSRLLNFDQASSILRSMSNEKKETFITQLGNLAKADGKLNKNELDMIDAICNIAKVNFFNIEEDSSEEIVSMYMFFVSNGHIRYENSIALPKNVGNRAIKIEDNTKDNIGYIVTIFNLDGNHPQWGNNIQMAPKQMKIVSRDKTKTIIRGWGKDPNAFGDPIGDFSRFGMTIFHLNNKVERIISHMHDRNVDIEYL